MKKSRVVTKIFLSSVLTRFHQQLFEHYEYLMIISVSPSEYSHNKPLN